MPRGTVFGLNDRNYNKNLMKIARHPTFVYYKAWINLTVELNSLAPGFHPPRPGRAWNIRFREYRGQWVLLYFYPKDDTPGCTKEACTIRDAFPHFKGLNIKVLGVSVDSLESHKKFAEKYRLPFTLLSDEHKKVVTRYGVWGENIQIHGTRT